METVEIIDVLLNTPFLAVLLYLLIAEQRAHSETRAKRDDDNRLWVERFAGMSERVTSAVERLDLPGPM